MIKFAKIAKYAADADLPFPTRATANSAGYDFVVAEDIVIPPYAELMKNLSQDDNALDIAEVARRTKEAKAKPTLVPTGVKCYLEPDTYLELSVRSSTPLKNWLILANGVGIIDADYADNPDNEGAIYFQLINLSPWHIKLHRGDKIGQGIIKHYLKTDDDNASGVREGGFGSTSK